MTLPSPTGARPSRSRQGRALATVGRENKERLTSLATERIAPLQTLAIHAMEGLDPKAVLQTLRVVLWPEGAR